MQASAFARSDTPLQLAWVIGGFVGIAMPLMPRLGLGIAAGVLLAGVRARVRDAARPAPPGPGRPGVAAQSSSSSARARSTLAVGLAVRASGWRPWR